MTTPRPDQLERVLGELVDLVADIHNDYRWAYSIGFEQRNTGPDNSRRAGPADPTGQVTVDHQRFRHNTEQAAKHTIIALKNLRGAARMLADAFRIIDRDSEYVPSDKTDYRDRDISHSELEERRRIKIRRERAGEGFGLS